MDVPAALSARGRYKKAATYGVVTGCAMAAAAFEWTDKFLLGYGPMDTVHREFVELVNALITCPDDQMAAQLDAFIKHADSHFGDELKLMQETGFPATECHADEHAAVLNSTKQVQELVAKGNIAIARSLAAELARWFPGHADYMDSALAHWVVKKRTGGAPLVLKRGIRCGGEPAEEEAADQAGCGG